MIDLRSEARRGARVAAFGTLTTGMLGTFVLHERLGGEADRRARRERYLHVWSGALIDLFGIRLQVVDESAGAGGLLAPDGPHGRLVVANHRSTIDIGLLLHVFGGHMVSREDLAHWPLIGRAAKSVETIFVDRESTTSGVQAIRQMSRYLEMRRSVTVFPEGTTFPDDEVRPFHKGAFVAAKAADARILPVGLAYASGADAAYVEETFVEHLGRIAAARETRVALVVGPPLAPRANASRTAEAARDAVADLVRRARALL